MRLLTQLGRTRRLRRSTQPGTRSAMVRIVVAGVLLTVTGCAGGPPGAGEAATVRVAAASDLQFAMDDIAAAMATADPPVRVLATYGSSGTFYQQIRNGAPFGVYLSADMSYPQELVDAGVADEDDLFRYAVGRLVVWAPDGSPADPSAGLAGLTDPAVTRVAIANPEHAPYGRAAVAAMTSAGVYGSVRDKLVLGENVAQAAEFAASGNAQVAVVALSLVTGTPLADQGDAAEVPRESFPPLHQGGLVLPTATDRQAALAVREFLSGPEGAAILTSYGFAPPED